MTENVGNRVIPIVSITAVVLIMVVLTIARSASEGNASDTRALPSPVDSGRQIYQMVCTTCHDPDPTVDRVGGTFGPPIAGSSLELLQLRVLGTEYPEGYTPKRDTGLMTPIPYLSSTQIRALKAFLDDPSAAPSQPAESSWPPWLLPVAVVGGLLMLMMFRRREDLLPRGAAS